MKTAFLIPRALVHSTGGRKQRRRWRKGGVAGALATLGLLLGPGSVGVASVGAAAGPQAGVSAAVRGTVLLKQDPRPDVIGIRADDGAAVFLGNSIKSAPAAGMQLMLLDETTVTVGEDAELAVDEFVYDPAQNTGKLDMRLVKGTFRLVTGGISDMNPAATTIRTPTATIGIRGTIVLIQVTETGTTVALGGPGSNKDSRERVGAVEVTTAKGTVLITRPGFATSFSADGAMSPPRRLTDVESADIAYRLTRDGINTNATIRDVMKGADSAAPASAGTKDEAAPTPAAMPRAAAAMTSAVLDSGAPLTEGIRQAVSASGKAEIVVAADFREVENTQTTNFGNAATRILAPQPKPEATPEPETPAPIAPAEIVEEETLDSGTVDYGLSLENNATPAPYNAITLDPTLYQQAAAFAAILSLTGTASYGQPLIGLHYFWNAPTRELVAAQANMAFPGRDTIGTYDFNADANFSSRTLSMTFSRLTFSDAARSPGAYSFFPDGLVMKVPVSLEQGTVSGLLSFSAQQLIPGTRWRLNVTGTVRNGPASVAEAMYHALTIGYVGPGNPRPPVRYAGAGLSPTTARDEAPPSPDILPAAVTTNIWDAVNAPGIASYTATAVPLYNQADVTIGNRGLMNTPPRGVTPVGSYNFNAVIDFATRQITSSVWNIAVASDPALATADAATHYTSSAIRSFFPTDTVEAGASMSLGDSRPINGTTLQAVMKRVVDLDDDPAKLASIMRQTLSITQNDTGLYAGGSTITGVHTRQ